MAEPTPDPVATDLAEAKANLLGILAECAARGWEPALLAQHSERLLVVADAALALVTEWRGDAASLDKRAEKAADAGDTPRSLLLSYRAQAHTDCAAQLKAAIELALLGEGKPHD